MNDKPDSNQTARQEQLDAAERAAMYRAGKAAAFSFIAVEAAVQKAKAKK